MIYLLEAIWYGFLIVVRIAWLPALIIGGIALICRLFGAAKRAMKENKKK